MSSVRPITQREIPASGVLCLAIAHNEAAKLEDFLRHHRALGVVHFLIVDDGSTDGTGDLLRAQTDVTLFSPDGTNYRDHKVSWRTDILDAHAQGRWVVLPDIDELFVYPHFDTCSVKDLAEYLDSEGAEAAFAPMVEMYADAPLDNTTYRPGDSMLAAFPFFDREGYRLIGRRPSSLKRFPTPALDVHGGPRERLFYDFTPEALSPPRRWALTRFAHIRRPMRPTALERAGNMLARLALTGKAPRPPLVMSKIALLKWRRGLSFSGGPHAISQPLPLSEIWGALLHFKFIDLPRNVAYCIRRQQHAGGARHYRTLDAKKGFERSPLHERSRRFSRWEDLLECGLLRSSAGWERAQIIRRSIAPRGDMGAPRRKTAG